VPVPRSIRIEKLAKLACASCAAVWGLFWIPLRALDDAGIHGPWATALFAVVPLVLLLPLLVTRWNVFAASGWPLQRIGLLIGISFVCYSNAFLYTDVIRVLVLFYMTIVWGTLLARIWLKETISFSRGIAIILGFSGMFVILSAEPGIPQPSNVGDWLGLISGLAWAFAAVLMKREKKTDPRDLSVSYFIWATIIALSMLWMPFLGQPEVPDSSDVVDVLPWFIPVVLLLLIPATFALTWGAPLLSPGVTGILFMTELSVATIAAAVLTGESFGAREILGVLLITLAGLTEIIVVPLKALLDKSHS